MRHRSDEIFEIRCERLDYDMRTRIGWRSHRYGLSQTVDLRETWTRELSPEPLLEYIERLVGNTLRNFHELRVQDGQAMAEALMPHFEREIFLFMERMEQQYARPRRYQDYGRNVRFNREDLLYGWDMAFDRPAEDPKAKQKARELLIRNLDAGQEKSFKKDGEFRVTAKDGKAYTIKTARSFNVVGPDGTKYCGQLRDTPIEDQMLAQKLLLEHEPEKFFKNANVSPASGGITATEIQMRAMNEMMQFRPGAIIPTNSNWGI